MANYSFEEGYGPEEPIPCHRKDGQLSVDAEAGSLPFDWDLLAANGNALSEKAQNMTWAILINQPLLPAEIHTPYLYMRINSQQPGQPLKWFAEHTNILNILRCYLFTRKDLTHDPYNPRHHLTAVINDNAERLFKTLMDKFDETVQADEELGVYAAHLRDNYAASGNIFSSEDDSALLTRFAILLITYQHNYTKILEQTIYALCGMQPTHFNSAQLPVARELVPGGVSQLAYDYLCAKARSVHLEFLVPASFTSDERPFDRQYLRILLMLMCFTSADIKQV
jgi:hypothetical protein